MNAIRRPTSITAVNSIAFVLGLILLGFAPLIRGGNRHVALAALDGVGLLVLLAIGWRMMGPPIKAESASRPLVSKSVLLVVLSPVWVGLLQLTPVPINLWAMLPGHAAYQEALVAIQSSASAFRAVSLTPDATWVAVLAGVPITAAFMLAHTCSQRQLDHFLTLWVVLAVLQAVIGLLQVGGLPWLYFGAETFGNGRPVGTFANANHFADWLAMALPLAVMKFRRLDLRSTAFGEQSGAHVLWGLAVFVLLAGILMSRSRAGIGTALLSMSLAIVLLPSRAVSPMQRKLWLWGMLGLVAALLASVGVSWISRFSSGAVTGDASFRGYLFSSTWQAALDFFPLGSGLGSYATVYPRYQPSEVRGFAEHAHSDYVQLLMECGLLFMVLAGLVLGLVVKQSRELARRAASPKGLDVSRRVRLCCGLGLLALFLHSWVDFNLRIPANAMFGAFLLGAFLRPPRSAGSDERFASDSVIALQ